MTPNKKPKISVLVSARKDSKYLAKFLTALIARTFDMSNIEVLVMLPADDTWNEELIAVFRDLGICFYREDYHMGRAGLHIYYNDLARLATGDWLVYFCEDHLIILDNWDQYILTITEDLAPPAIWCLIPGLQNRGVLNKVNHILSRGFYETLGAIGKNAWIDSYLNDITERIPQDRVRVLDEVAMIYDFSADNPGPMAEAAAQSVLDPNFKPGTPGYLGFSDPKTRQLVETDANLLNKAIERGL